MAIDVKAEVQIARTREDVAAYVVNPENDPLWIGGIKSARMLTEPPVGVGTRVAGVASFMGKRIEYTPEVVAYEANSLLTMRTDKPFEMESVTKGLGRKRGACLRWHLPKPSHLWRRPEGPACPGPMPL